MKTWLLRIFFGIIVLVAVVIVLLLLFGPKDVRVTRSTTIDASPEAVFAHLEDLRKWNAWSPWVAKDPEMKQTWEGPESGVGQKASWESETQGTGTQTITKSEPPNRLETELDFGEMGTATSDWTLEKEGDGTKVTWGLGMKIGMNPVEKFFGLMMDGLVGPDYEAGLANLKKVIEAGE